MLVKGGVGVASLLFGWAIKQFYFSSPNYEEYDYKTDPEWEKIEGRLGKKFLKLVAKREEGLFPVLDVGEKEGVERCVMDVLGCLERKYSVEIGTCSSSSSLAPPSSSFSLEDDDPDREPPFYQREFASHPHFNFGAETTDSTTPLPLLLSLLPLTKQTGIAIIRTEEGDMRRFFKITNNIDVTNGGALLQSFLCSASPPLPPSLPSSPLSWKDLGREKKLEELLLQLEGYYTKQETGVGVLYGKRGQTENEMYNNKDGSKDFNEFLGFLGERIQLKGWGGFRGGLDVGMSFNFILLLNIY